MATSYVLVLTKDVRAEEVLTRVQALVGGERPDDRQLAVLPGLVVSAGPIESLPARAEARDDWGAEMRTSVSFAVGYQAEPELRYDAEGLMSVAAARLVVDLDTDAGFSYENERRLLRRRAGVLSLYRWWPQWSEPGIVERLPTPFEFTDEDSHFG